MLHLIPAVKKLELTGGCFQKKSVSFQKGIYDIRLEQALEKLPHYEWGAPITLEIVGNTGEAYALWIRDASIDVKADSAAGAFYAIQTLRQVFQQQEIPCLYIQDKPDFPHRGFYHDVTRGKVPTVETIKQLVDTMAYYKLNSLQLYVEHTFEFEECKALHPHTSCLTAEELAQIGAYCRENFIDFIPSLSTFGHMYEILQQEQYQHLRVLHPYTPSPNFWRERMQHHTIDPLKPESIELVKSLIDQYVPHFPSDWFNICCDETFDLKQVYGNEASGKIYVDFVKQIIAHVKSKGKKVMMWADILLQHPEVIDEVPEDTCFLNWHYSANPPEADVEKFAQLGRTQIVCPGTSTWNRLCEDVEKEEQNISLMAQYGYAHGAVGILNTNWGDWGNPCNLELAMYGLVLGAEKGWSISTKLDDSFYAGVDALLYQQPGAMEMLKKVSKLHSQVSWRNFIADSFLRRYPSDAKAVGISAETVAAVQAAYTELSCQLRAQVWPQDAYRQELLVCLEGICVIAELWGKLAGLDLQRITDTQAWLTKYRASWLARNKESELPRIEEMFLYCGNI